ncbi:hypothetical protein GCM10010269_23320 [Streptomyces humidus]|uniref:Uncharacterized protein n=1 Tax=Streptomyces humidus TaxID=52259 RepID=A0A918FUD7_9ACTN|nr:hypothetical protein [Streptomyces humidus]GGR83532.1 hypothetical protein GCM10010269_23320 [Streptomyces humidus]
MASSFEANPYLTRRGAQILADIAEHANALVNDLAHYKPMLTGWAGEDDDYAKQVGPNIRKSYRQTLSSGQQVTQAIVSVVDNTAGSGRHVERAQDEAFEGIAAEQAGYGRH